MMKRLLISLIALFPTAFLVSAQISIEYCFARAEENYPLIKKYDLVSKTGLLNLSDIDKGWLPRISPYFQATVQNTVPGFPEALTGILDQMGHNLRGMGKLQYKAGVELTQTVWDGGRSASLRETERAVTEEQKGQLDVEMYAIREKVQELFFGILLMDAQISQTRLTTALLENNLSKIKSMVKNGTAMQCDADMIEAQLLTTRQQLAEAESRVTAYRRVLEVYIDESLEDKTLMRPKVEMPLSLESRRPELNLFDRQRELTAARSKAVDTSVRPNIGFFTQAYYGYPGMNYFESMSNRNLSFNILAGIRISWNLDSFYTKRNSLRKLSLTSEGIETNREVFLFNSSLQTKAQSEIIEGLKNVIKDDSRIVELRTDVRRAAESQLQNGVIDTTSLLTKITDENRARLTSQFHEIELLQQIYKLKQILNQ